MPTVNEVMERVDRVKPNAFEEPCMAGWLMELDGRVYEELTKADAPDALPPGKWPEDGDKKLLVSPPYDNMYDLYLTAMIEFAQGEYSAYNNTAALFDRAWKDYRAKYRREHLPKASYLQNVF